MIIEELVTVLGFRNTGTAQLETYKRGIQGVSTAINSLQAAAVRAAAVLGTLGVSIGGISLVKGVIDAGMKFEKFQAILETVEGSSEKAKASLDWVADFAKRTPYELEEVTSAFVRMRAYGLDPTDGSLERVGDAGAAMGKNIMSGVEAVADAVTFQFERLKEFGVTTSTAGDQVTFNWTQNGVAMTKTVKKQGTEIAKALNEIFSMYEGAMARLSRTLEGIWSNISDSWQAFLRSIADAGFFQEIKRRSQALLDTMNRLADDGTLTRWANNISNVLVKVLQVADTIVWAFRRAGEAVAFLGRKIQDITGISWGALLGAGGFAVLVRRHPMIAFFMALIAILDDLRVYLSGEGKSIIGLLVDKFNEFAESFPGVASAIMEVGSALFYLAAGLVAFKVASTGIRAAGAAIAAVFGGLGIGAAAGGGAAVGAAAGAGGVAGASLSRWGGRLAAFTRIAGRLSLWLGAASIVGDLVPKFGAIGDRIRDGNLFKLGGRGKGSALDIIAFQLGESLTNFFGLGGLTPASYEQQRRERGPSMEERYRQVEASPEFRKWAEDRGLIGPWSGTGDLGLGGPGRGPSWQSPSSSEFRSPFNRQRGTIWNQRLDQGRHLDGSFSIVGVADIATRIAGQIAAAIVSAITGSLATIRTIGAGLGMLGGAIGMTSAATAMPASITKNVTVTVSAPVSITMNGTTATPQAVAGAVSGAIGGAADRAADILASEPGADVSPALGAAGAAS